MKTHNSQFDTIASYYEQTLPTHITDHYRRKRVDFIKGFLSSGQILDVGCGTGVLVHSLSQAGYCIFGVDYSIGMLKILEEKRPGFQAQASAMALPFPSGTFDLVMNVATLHHLAEFSVISLAINEMFRVVRKGGHLLIWDHNPLNPYWKLLMQRLPQDSGDERLIPRHEILSIISNENLSVASMKVYNLGFIPDFIPRQLMDLASKVEKLLERIPLIRYLSAHNVFLFKKA